MTFDRVARGFAAGTVVAFTLAACIVVIYYFLKGVGHTVSTELLWFWLGSGYAFAFEAGLEEYRR